MVHVPSNPDLLARNISAVFTDALRESLRVQFAEVADKAIEQAVKDAEAAVKTALRMWIDPSTDLVHIKLEVETNANK